MSTQLNSYDEKVSDSLQRLFPNKIISGKQEKGHCSKSDASVVQKSPFETRKCKWIQQYDSFGVIA